MPNGSQQLQRVCFRVENGWIFLSEKLGKMIMRAQKIGRIKKESDRRTQHRGFEFECWETVKVRSKLFDISKFLEK